MDVVCVECGRHFQGMRSTAKYCSDRCRTIAHRKRHAPPGPARRRPLAPQFYRPSHAVNNAAHRLHTLAQDDRVPANRQNLRYYAQEIRRAIELLEEVEKLLA